VTIAGLKGGRSPGPSGVRNEHIKEARDLAPCWAALFNRCLQQGRIPEAWREATLVALPKGKGDPAEPTSWRGIALKDCCFKLLSKIVTQRLTRFLEGMGVIPEEQHGFRRGKSTATACRGLLGEIHRALRQPRTLLYAVFVDFKAAFDYAPRDVIAEKLARAGVPGQMLTLVGDIL